jgi:hypothetical protein
MSILRNFMAKEISNAKSPGFAKFLAWGVGLVGAVLIAPFIFLAVKGIVGLGLALASGWLLIKLAPWFSTWSSNLALKLIRYEARVNPIETMMSVYKERREATDEAEKQIKTFNGQVETYDAQVLKLAKEYPEDAKKFQTHLQAMKQLLDRRYRALLLARAKLENYYKGIERASAIWDMTKAQEAISKSAGLLSEKDAIQRIRSDEALKAVENSMAASFAELDHALRTELEEDGTPLLQVQDSTSSQPLFLTPSGAYEVREPIRKN